MRRSSATRSSISSYRFRWSPRSAALPGRRAGLFQSKLALQHVVGRLHPAADSPQKDQAPAIVSGGPPRYHNPAVWYVWYCCMLSADRDNPESRGRKVRRCLSNSGATTGFARVGFAGITRSPKLHAFKDFARFATRSPKSRSRFDAIPPATIKALPRADQFESEVPRGLGPALCTGTVPLFSTETI